MEPEAYHLRTFARKSSNIDNFIKLIANELLVQGQFRLSVLE